MTRTFGRRTAAVSTPAARAQPPTPAALFDPRAEALAATMHDGDPIKEELRDYLARRRAAIGLGSWMVDALYIAPALASYGLGVPWPWLIPISAASFGTRTMLKRGRLRWAAQIEAGARPPAAD